MTYPPIAMCHVVGCQHPAIEISWSEQLLVGIQLCKQHSFDGPDAEEIIQLDLTQVREDHAFTVQQMQWSPKQ